MIKKISYYKNKECLKMLEYQYIISKKQILLDYLELPAVSKLVYNKLSPVINLIKINQFLQVVLTHYRLKAHH